MIRIATAECFTHGNVAREIHAFSQGYPLSYPWILDPEEFHLSLTAGLFIPTLTGVRSILRIEPIIPAEIRDDIKIYDQQNDEAMALMMARSVKKITGADIGIGTTAGIGKGGISIVSDWCTRRISSDYEADLRRPDPFAIQKRQRSGIINALRSLEAVLTEYFPP